jgi:hypothetical protein
MKVIKVNKLTAMNPVARAVAQQELRSVIREKKVRLFQMVDDDECVELLEAIGLTVGIAGYASTLQPLNEVEQEHLDVVKFGINACNLLIQAGKFNIDYADAIADALDSAEYLNRKISAQNLNRAVSAMNLIGVTA